jgi:hypothetical protein
VGETVKPGPLRVQVQGTKDSNPSTTAIHATKTSFTTLRTFALIIIDFFLESYYTCTRSKRAYFLKCNIFLFK